MSGANIEGMNSFVSRSISQKEPLLYGSARLWRIPTGALQTNAYVLANKKGQAFIIDPGDEPERFTELFTCENLTPKAILLSHAHFDHIGAVEPLRAYGTDRGEAMVPVFLHPADLPLYDNAHQSAARYNLPFCRPSAPDGELLSDQCWELEGDVCLRVRELPGHAPGHVIFIGEGFVLAGDTLFAGGIGRTDLPLGSHPQLLAGIARELLTLPPETVVYSGHGEPTTIAREKASNPFLRHL